jgi:hypothetical protein
VGQLSDNIPANLNDHEQISGDPQSQVVVDPIPDDRGQVLAATFYDPNLSLKLGPLANLADMLNTASDKVRLLTSRMQNVAAFRPFHTPESSGADHVIRRTQPASCT